MSKIPRLLKRSNPEAVAVESIEAHDAAREAAAATAALPIRKPAPVTPRPPNEVESGRWVAPPSLNFAKTAWVRSGNRSETVDPTFLLLTDVATGDELAALREAEVEIARLVTLKSAYSHGAIDKRHKDAIAGLHVADSVDAAALAKLNRSRDEEKELSNSQRHVIDSHISRVQVSIVPLIRDLFGRGSKVLEQEVEEYEQELSARSARYGLTASPTDALLALRNLRDRCASSSLPEGALPAGEWRASGVLRKIFHDANQVISVTAENEAMAE